MPPKILFLIPYPLQRSPSQRFRFEQYFGLLEQNGFTYEIRPFHNSPNRNYFLESGQKTGIISFFFKGIARRWRILFELAGVNFVFIHREVAPLGPPFFEFIIARVFRKKVIYDFDDAIWLSDRAYESWLFRALKCRSKTGAICRMSYRVSCGNHYLADYARRHNPSVVYNPTTIDTLHVHNSALFPDTKKSDRIVIGWTGSFSTLKYLKSVESVIQRIQSEFPQVDLLVIADKKPALAVDRVEFIPWNLEKEITDLLRMDIGIMPLPVTAWAKGKCGFKILQYMALKIPSLASPVGVNTEIISHGENGFLCSSDQEWYNCLRLLINDTSKRAAFGKLGRAVVEERYSVQSNAGTFLSLFE